MGARKKSYEKLLLLYTLRFDLPDDQNKQKYVQNIENLIVHETINIIEDACNKGTEYVKECIQMIKTEFINETDAVLLLNNVTEKLPRQVQKLIWEEFA